MRVAHLEPFSGASGDMLLGAVIDAGVETAALAEILDGLDVSGWSLAAEAVTRAGLGATQAVVRTDEGGVVRTWGNVRSMLEEAKLPEPVRDRALGTFRRLAEAEASVHRTDPERVHFHEVGALDAIVDIVGACAGFHLLGVERVTSGAVAQGIGMTRSAHGLLPLPAPAVLELLRGAPTYSLGVTAELCTPTGAALLAELVDEWTSMPPLRIERVGYGAGSRTLDQPNVLRLVLGEATGEPGARPAVLIETTVDDLTGELVAHVLDALRAAGADDAWARQVVMKKGRPGVEIACIAPVARGDELRRVLFAETTTLGVRSRLVDKWALERTSETVTVAGHPVRLKIGWLEGRVVNVAPEFDDCAAVGSATGMAVKEVYALARAAWQRDARTTDRPDGHTGPPDATA